MDSKTTVFEDGGVQNISRIKINWTPINVNDLQKRTTNFQEKRFISKELRIRTQKKSSLSSFELKELASKSGDDLLSHN